MTGCVFTPLPLPSVSVIFAPFSRPGDHGPTRCGRWAPVECLVAGEKGGKSNATVSEAQ